MASDLKLQTNFIYFFIVFYVSHWKFYVSPATARPYHVDVTTSCDNHGAEINVQWEMKNYEEQMPRRYVLELAAVDKAEAVHRREGDITTDDGAYEEFEGLGSNTTYNGKIIHVELCETQPSLQFTVTTPVCQMTEATTPNLRGTDSPLVVTAVATESATVEETTRENSSPAELTTLILTTPTEEIIYDQTDIGIEIEVTTNPPVAETTLSSEVAATLREEQTQSNKLTTSQDILSRTEKELPGVQTVETTPTVDQLKTSKDPSQTFSTKETLPTLGSQTPTTKTYDGTASNATTEEDSNTQTSSQLSFTDDYINDTFIIHLRGFQKMTSSTSKSCFLIIATKERKDAGEVFQPTVNKQFLMDLDLKEKTIPEIRVGEHYLAAAIPREGVLASNNSVEIGNGNFTECSLETKNKTESDLTFTGYSEKIDSDYFYYFVVSMVTVGDDGKLAIVHGAQRVVEVPPGNVHARDSNWILILFLVLGIVIVLAFILFLICAKKKKKREEAHVKADILLERKDISL